MYKNIVIYSFLLFSFHGIAQDSHQTLYENINIESDTVKRLKEIVVQKNPANSKTNAGKAGIKAMDLPQAISVISKEELKNQQVATVSDILKNANGVYIMGATGGYQEEIASRGFSFEEINSVKSEG